ncbi:DNA (cytosine-5)-methyltransferase 3B [Armadillidium vulgare]|nr:DNA (cytosine-5)-methyltransferase 3B [Armadillidium vulgare]
MFDPTGTGILFFHFFRVQKVIEKCNGKERRLFWFFENVSSMSKEYKAQIRMYKALPEELTSQKHSLSDSVIKECNRKANVEILNCVTTNPNSLLLSKGVDYPIIMNGQPDVPWITELERVSFICHYSGAFLYKMAD